MRLTGWTQFFLLTYFKYNYYNFYVCMMVLYIYSNKYNVLTVVYKVKGLEYYKWYIVYFLNCFNFLSKSVQVNIFACKLMCSFKILNVNC